MSKNRVIVEAVPAGQSHGAVALQYGISKVWVGKLVARWRLGGWDAVEKQSTRPKSSPHASDEDTIARVTGWRRQLSEAGLDAGPHSIAAHLTRAGHRAPSVTTIWRILTRAELITPEPRKRPRRSYLRFEADLPNECWQSDFTHWPLADGQDCEILTFLDDHSRYIVDLTAHATVTGQVVLDRFRAAIDTHGIPASTLTDNGMVFTTRQRGGRNSFERELVILGIDQKNGRPNHPQTQGKVERFQQTLKKWLRAQPAAATLGGLQTQLDQFTQHYNHDRPHRSSTTAPPPTPTPPEPRPHPTAATGTGESDTTKSTRPDASPSDTPRDCITSDSATSTPAPPSASSSTTYTSRSSTPTAARSSATSPWTPAATTSH